MGDDTPFAQRLNARKEAKARIGARAARLIADEETLLINGGSTVLALAAALGGRRGLTVVTNNLSLPAVLPPQAVDAVYMLGGEVRQSLQVTLGPVGFAGAGSISADTAVLGVGGLSAAGLSTTRLNEATMLAAMVAAARRTIVLADSAKLGKDSFVRIAPGPGPDPGDGRRARGRAGAGAGGRRGRGGPGGGLTPAGRRRGLSPGSSPCTPG